MTIQRFLAIIEKGVDGFGVTFPDFPGCVSHGLTVQEAAEQAENALAGHVAAMVADGDPMPTPMTLDDMVTDPDIQEVARILVRVNLLGNEGWPNISLDEDLIEQIDAEAASIGVSRSAFWAEAARRQRMVSRK
ncbi:MAG: type II toxin-antitoxin system HicB family antitoxin [Magnetococcus sp. THC-1_WYH]